MIRKELHIFKICLTKLCVQELEWTKEGINPYRLWMYSHKNILFLLPLQNILKHNDIVYSVMIYTELNIYTILHNTLCTQQSKWTTEGSNPYILWMHIHKSILFVFSSPLANTSESKVLSSSYTSWIYCLRQIQSVVVSDFWITSHCQIYGCIWSCLDCLVVCWMKIQISSSEHDPSLLTGAYAEPITFLFIPHQNSEIIPQNCLVAESEIYCQFFQ